MSAHLSGIATPLLAPAQWTQMITTTCTRSTGRHLSVRALTISDRCIRSMIGWRTLSTSSRLCRNSIQKTAHRTTKYLSSNSQTRTTWKLIHLPTVPLIMRRWSQPYGLSKKLALTVKSKLLRNGRPEIMTMKTITTRQTSWLVAMIGTTRVFQTIGAWNKPLLS